ncbi:hypothetical protein LCL98_19180 [Rossellomorea aquimaris]|nr:hypothetical protein [Rossellomorea aquimaris]
MLRKLSEASMLQQKINCTFFFRVATMFTKRACCKRRDLSKKERSKSRDLVEGEMFHEKQAGLSYMGNGQAVDLLGYPAGRRDT